MNKLKFTEDQIFAILQQSEQGATAAELCAQHAMSLRTLYYWKVRYRNLTRTHKSRLEQLEEENRNLKKLYADACIELNELKKERDAHPE